MKQIRSLLRLKFKTNLQSVYIVPIYTTFTAAGGEEN